MRRSVLDDQRAAAGNRGWKLLVVVGLMASVAAACGGPSAAARGGGEEGCDAEEATRVVELLGERMKQVSLLAPAYEVRAEIRENYTELVTPRLLDQWLFRPDAAPGREVSSPWPERIEIDTVGAAEGGGCLVKGKIVYLTSEEVTHGGAAALLPVAMRVERQGGAGWRIATYEVWTPPAPGPADIGGAPTPGMAPDTGARLPPDTVPADTSGTSTPPPDSTTATAAAAVIQHYYDLIAAGQYREAYELWGEGGRASGQSFEEFRAGYAETTSVSVGIGEPGRIEGAAGSRYVSIPVVINATTTAGERQRFTGSYTLRRVVVEGAAPAEMRWHIYSAEIVRAR